MAKKMSIKCTTHADCSPKTTTCSSTIKFVFKKKIRRKISIQFWTAVKMVYRTVWKCIIFGIKFWSFLSVDNWYTDMTKHIKLKMFECVPRVNGISTKKETCGQWIKIQQHAFGLISIIYLNLFFQ